jgi:hypothetical protein
MIIRRLRAAPNLTLWLLTIAWLARLCFLALFRGVLCTESTARVLGRRLRFLEEEYRRRMGELRDEINEGERSNDAGAVDRTRAEFEILSQQLGNSIGLLGRARTFA